MPYIGNNHIAGDHTNNFKVLDDISSYTATFDGSASSVVDTTNNTITISNHGFKSGDKVIHTATSAAGLIISSFSSCSRTLFMIESNASSPFII